MFLFSPHKVPGLAECEYPDTQQAVWSGCCSVSCQMTTAVFLLGLWQLQMRALQHSVPLPRKAARMTLSRSLSTVPGLLLWPWAVLKKLTSCCEHPSLQSSCILVQGDRLFQEMQYSLAIGSLPKKKALVGYSVAGVKTFTGIHCKGEVMSEHESSLWDWPRQAKDCTRRQAQGTVVGSTTLMAWNSRCEQLWKNLVGSKGGINILAHKCFWNV